MSIQRVTRIQCDDCEDIGPVEGVQARDTRRDLAEWYGWILEGVRDICPNCQVSRAK